ncbi:MAG: hypothetical protein K9N49_00950 [Candidatus Marinimicrobia bacterium]|nr:hypothetical protein [Candidatus Neomarinimicrobiota bacterium]
MRKMIGWLWIGLLLGPLAGEVAAQVTIRLARAHQDNQEVAVGLRDVAGLLRANLPYQGFALLGATRVGLPAENKPQRLGPLEVRCQGGAERLSVSVARDGRTLLNTVVALRRGQPIILGGFPDGTGRLMLILQTR